MMPTQPIKVLVVDDSRAVRAAFDEMLSTEADIVIVGLAADPYEAVAIMRGTAPDVVILDIVMPRMDGITFLGKIMDQHPLPVVICSSHVSSEESSRAVLALEGGAVEVIPKPRLDGTGDFGLSRDVITAAIRAAARARPTRRVRTADTKTADARAGLSPVRRDSALTSEAESRRRVVVIGASTGGTEALRVVLGELPLHVPGIVIAQHMPAGFTSAFAARLDSLCALTVAEASEGAAIVPGSAFVAPGNMHVMVRRGHVPHVMLSGDEPVNRHRPSVDVLFHSAASEFRDDALGILLTGMGSDGAQGLAEMRATGAETIAQDEATSVVFGMSASAIKLGAARLVLPVHDVAAAIVRWAEKGASEA